MNTSLLIDTDPGVDDALALLLAAAHPQADIAAITVCAGNVGLEHTLRNALKLVELLDLKVPVYAGASAGLGPPAGNADFVHGRDGFGDTGYLPPRRRAEPLPAAVALVEHARKAPGRHTLVALGPLTNVALALRLEPELPRLLRRLVVMGGAVAGYGNTAVLAAEFNFGFDPEAAALVFEAWPQLDLVDWQAVLGQGLARAEVDAWLASGRPHARFLRAISGATLRFAETRGEAVYLADPIAMALAVVPDLAGCWRPARVEIALEGRLTRGMSVVDWDGRSGRPANARIAGDIDGEGLRGLLAAALT